MLLCSIVMGVGTSVGGEKIIKSVGMNMVKLERYQGFSADLAGAICLLYSSLIGSSGFDNAHKDKCDYGSRGSKKAFGY